MPAAHACEQRRDGGFSLVEVIVATGLFVVFASAGAAVTIGSLHTSGDNRQRVSAANLADQEIEVSRAAFRDSPASVANETVYPTVGANSFTVSRQVKWLSAAGSAVCSGQPCTVATGSDLVVQVQVSWPGLGSRPPVINTTVLS